MKITKNLSVAALAVSLLLPALSSVAGVTESLDADWRFAQGDPSDATTDLNYTAALPWLLPMQNGFTTKAPVAAPADNFGGSVAYTQPGFDDSGWRKLNLPHDFGEFLLVAGCDGHGSA